MEKSSHVICGVGEVGSALKSILNADGHDELKGISAEGSYEYLHIAFGYSPSFIETVREYQKRFTPQYTIIHSSVPLGTSDACSATHSPIRGVHPNLEQSIRTFVKFFGGPESVIVARPFEERGVPCYTFPNAKDAEAMKMWDLAQYGAFIMLEKEIYQYCQDNGLDMDVVYAKANETYNAGYRTMGRDEVVRPYLKHVDGKIGGHCIIPVTAMLESETAQNIIQKNEQL